MKMIPIAEPWLGEEELTNVTEAVKSGWISSKGRFILDFEKEFARYCRVRHGVATANGTVALHLALVALGIGRGDEVIVPTLSFIATANAVTYTGAKPVFIDSHPDYWCIDHQKIQQSMTPRTKAIIPVHLYGHPCDMDAIMDIARQHNLYVIEDAAEAHGAKYKDKTVGSFGHVGCFSFYGNKIITTGEGGLCLTNDDQLAEKMRTLRDHGMDPNKRYWHDMVGFNYRMTNMQAAVGLAQSKKLDKFIEKKREIAGWYAEGLKDLAERGFVKLHPEMPWAESVYWMYSILIEDSFGMQKDELMLRLAEGGMETRSVFYPIHIMPPYEAGEKFPVAEGISRRGLSLPSGVKLTRSEIEQVCERIAVNAK